ncbi:TonB-dependent receptor [Undibacterium amnicola]|uniref:TonB-dependent receptor n=1 Tax=Undibacterium amnicola TaxID=1834038 RepID=A0ABR6XT66_9BURK|nr:TonB-dependent receptor [Undibacterium amnicola]MBC3832695.1 TonB-dependent receptor [Undibacterium amnicola]
MKQTTSPYSASTARTTKLTNTSNHVAIAGKLSAISFGVLCMMHAQAQTQVSTNNSAEPQSITISGQRASLRKALELQEKADNIVSVVSSDDIGALPDKNAAEALARLPGVSVQRDQGEGRYITVRGLGPDLNAITINGALVPSPEASRRAVALDVLPSGIIRTLEVIKTLRPDMDANSLGATVEVKALTGFDLPQQVMSLNAGVSYDENIKKTSPNVGLLFTDRLLDGKFGIAAGLSMEKREFGSDNLETGGAWSNGRLSGLELRDYLPVRERQAFALNLDWRPNTESNYFMRSFISKFSDDEVRDRLTVSNVSGGALTEGVPATARLERRLRQRKYAQEINSFLLGTEQHIQDWKLEANIAQSTASDDTPDALNDARFRGTSNFNDISFTQTNLPKLNTPASAYDPSKFALNALTFQTRFSDDKEHHARVDLGKTFDLGDWDAKLKFGLKTSQRNKKNDTEQFAYSSSASAANYWGAGATSMSSFVGQELAYPLGRIGLGLDPVALRARVANANRAAARSTVESAINDFSMDENIDAAYIQNGFHSDKFSLLIGTRLERTQFDASGNKIVAGVATPNQSSRSYNNWLPTLQGRYDVDAKTSLRAAWTNAVVRANFSQLAPGVNLISSTEAQIGNPLLNPMKASNLDFGIERRLQDDGSVSAYLFHKDIKNFTYTTNLAGTAPWAGYTSAISYANGDKAKVHGLELGYSQSLRMLPAPFNHLIFSANLSMSKSDASIGRFDKASNSYKTRSIQLPGQSDRVGNLMLGYEDGAISTRLALNYKSPYLLEVGSDILAADQDRMVDTQKQVDFSLSYQINRRYQIVFEANNLNNEIYYVYLGTKALNAQYEQYGRTYKASLKINF